MNVPQHIFRAYDIRGFAHKPDLGQTPELTPEGMELIGQAAGSHFRQKYGHRIVVGFDARLSNPELSDAFIRGLQKTGCDITQIGLVPTPLLYFAVCHFGFDGGAAITASHNPKEYNGVKLVAQKAHSICGDELQEVYARLQAGVFEQGEGKIDTLDVFPAYLEKIVSLVTLERPLKIVVDSANGATGPFIQRLFESLGCTVHTLCTEPDGNFPNHPANPEEVENLKDLITAVREQNADLGLGFDGDGDRVGFVDEKGQHYSADLLLLLLAKDLLKRRPGSKVVFDVKVSQVLIDGIKEAGGEPVMTKTGHSFIESKMREIGALLGGEISGHLFFAENYYGFDDAFLGAARLLEIASKADHPFSEFFTALPKTICTPELKTPCPDSEKFRVVESLKAHFVQHYPCITLDGVRVQFTETAWGAVRASNTSPNLTIRFEAKNEEELNMVMQLMLAELRQHPELNLWWDGKSYLELSHP